MNSFTVKLINFLPSQITKRLRKSKNLQKIAANSGWLTFEKFYRLGFGLIVGVLVARHLGPSKYGVLQYASSIMSFMGTFVYLGLNGLVIRDLVREPENQGVLLGTTFALKLIGSIFGYIAILLIAFFYHDEKTEFSVLAIIGLTLFLAPFQVIDFWFQSQTQSKYSVFARSLSFSILSIGKLFLVYFAFGLSYFAAAIALESLLSVLCLIKVFRAQQQTFSDWRASFAKAKNLISQAWVIIISGFLSTVYLKMDQVMLRWLLDSEAVGVYSVAVTFSEVWYFIPEIICASLFPTLIKQKENSQMIYTKNLQKILDVLFAIALVVAVLVFLAGPTTICILYGEQYKQAGTILNIHIWAGLFVFMRALFSKWVFIEDLLIYSLVTHGAGAIANFIGNYLLIPVYGGHGAAIATLLSYAAASYFALFFSRKTVPMAAMMTKSLLLPLRLPFIALKFIRSQTNA